MGIETTQSTDRSIQTVWGMAQLGATVGKAEAVVQAAGGLAAKPAIASPAPISAAGLTVVPDTGRVSAAPAEHWRKRYHRRLLATDLLIITLALAIPPALVAIQEPPGLLGVGAANAFVSESGVLVYMAVLAASIGVAWALLLGYFHSRSRGSLGAGSFEYRAVFSASAFLAGTLSILAVIGPNTGLRSFILISLPVGLVALLIGRFAWRIWLGTQRKFGRFLSDVIVYGQGRDARYVVHQISKKAGAAYRVVGIVLDSEDSESQTLIAQRHPDIPIIIGGGRVEDQVTNLGADAVVVAGSLPGGNRAIQELGWRLEEARTGVILVPSLTNVATPRLRLQPVEGLPLLHVELPTFTGWRHVVKRTMDAVVSFFAILVLLPFFGIVALAVRATSPGNAIFRQTRTGRRGKPFTMYKFRSMVQTAEADLAELQDENEGAGPLFKMKNDPRVTKIGAFLRKYSLDEFPQFFNVLKGDMSLVGPRPPLPSEVATYEGHTHRRLYIKPGLTGLWQINGRSDLDWEESIRLDLYYVENWSVLGDLAIMWRTFKVMINPNGAY